MSTSYSVRLGAIAGWIGFVGVVGGLIVLPMILAGPPPTAWSPTSDAAAYFRHPELAMINAFVAVFLGAVAILVFGYGLRDWLQEGRAQEARAFADLGYVLLVVSVPIYVVSGALGAALVQAATGDPTAFPILFRFYEVLYNGAADVLEGAWVLSFSIAMLGSAMPRWLAWIGIAAGLSRWIKATVPFLAPIGAIEPVSGLLFVAFFLGVVVSLTAAARRGSGPSMPVSAAV